MRIITNPETKISGTYSWWAKELEIKVSTMRNRVAKFKEADPRTWVSFGGIGKAGAVPKIYINPFTKEGKTAKGWAKTLDISYSGFQQRVSLHGLGAERTWKRRGAPPLTGNGGGNAEWHALKDVSRD